MAKYINDFILNYLYHKKFDSQQARDAKESLDLELLNDVYVLKLAKRKVHRAISADFDPNRTVSSKRVKIPADFDSDSETETKADPGEVLSGANMTILQMISGQTGGPKQSPIKEKQKDSGEVEKDPVEAEEEEEQWESDADDEASEKEDTYTEVEKLKMFDGIAFALERFKQSILSVWMSLF